jgi:hypothetical protein
VAGLVISLQNRLKKYAVVQNFGLQRNWGSSQLGFSSFAGVWVPCDSPHMAVGRFYAGRAFAPLQHAGFSVLRSSL